MNCQIIRGGDYYDDDEQYVRCAYRLYRTPSYCYHSIGFRTITELQLRFLRGGSFRNLVFRVRCAYRHYFLAHFCGNRVGFRCVTNSIGDNT